MEKKDEKLFKKLLKFAIKEQNRDISGKLRYISEEDIAKLDQEQLAKGIEVEKEHTDDEKTARYIAAAHLLEFANYYKELDKMEKALKSQKKEKENGD